MTTYRDDFRIIEVTQQTAHLIPPLLYRVFGYTYTDHSLYCQEGVAESVMTGRNIYFAAIDEVSGEALGVLALRFTFRPDMLAELGMLAVDPAVCPATSGKMLLMLRDALRRKAQILAREKTLRCLLSTEVTVHTLTQRLVEQFGFATTGIYLGWTPSWAERLRSPPSERLGHSATTAAARGVRRTETVSALPFDKLVPPYPVAVPESLEPMLRRIYDSLQLRVGFVRGTPPEGYSTLTEDLDLRRVRAVLELTRVGSDAVDLLQERLDHYAAGRVDLVHIALPLTGTDLEPVVAALRASGALYAALLPLCRGYDVLMLQVVNAPFAPLAEGDLHSSIAKELFREVVAPAQAGINTASRS